MTRKDPKMDWCQERQIEIPRARTWHLRRFSAETSGCVTSRWLDRTMIWHDCRHDGTNVTSVFVYHLATTGPRRTVFAGFLEELWFFCSHWRRGKWLPRAWAWQHQATPGHQQFAFACICTRCLKETLAFQTMAQKWRIAAEKWRELQHVGSRLAGPGC